VSAVRSEKGDWCSACEPASADAAAQQPLTFTLVAVENSGTNRRVTCPARTPMAAVAKRGGSLSSVGLEGFFELRFDGRDGGPVTLHRNGEVGEHVRMDGGEIELLGRIAIQMEEQRWVVRDRRVGAIG